MVFDFAAFNDKDVGNFGGVDYAAAPYGDDHVAFVPPGKACAPFYSLDRRIRRDLVKCRYDFNIGAFKPFFHLAHRAGLFQNFIRDQDRPALTEMLDCIADVAQNSDAI